MRGDPPAATCSAPPEPRRCAADRLRQRFRGRASGCKDSGSGSLGEAQQRNAIRGKRNGRATHLGYHAPIVENSVPYQIREENFQQGGHAPDIFSPPRKALDDPRNGPPARARTAAACCPALPPARL